MHRVTVPLVALTVRVLLLVNLLTVPWVLLRAEGVVGDALLGGAADEAGGEERVVVRPDAMVRPSVWVVSGRWVWLVVWCSAWAAGAEYLRYTGWRGCAGGGGLSAWWRWVALWSCCRRSAVACVSGWGPLCLAAAVGVAASGAW